MRAVIALALVLLTAPVALATEGEERAREDEKVKPQVTEVATEEPEIRRAVQVVETRTDAEESAVQEMPRRGSFWWVVGAIVVAGIILAVIL